MQPAQRGVIEEGVAELPEVPNDRGIVEALQRDAVVRCRLAADLPKHAARAARCREDRREQFPRQPRDVSEPRSGDGCGYGDRVGRRRRATEEAGDDPRVAAARERHVLHQREIEVGAAAKHRDESRIGRQRVAL